MRIHLDPFFARSAITNQKKLIQYIFQEPWRNEEAIRILGEYLQQKQAEAKEAWEAASKRYQGEYISTRFRYDFTAQQKRATEAAHRKMLNEVKRCKAEYEHWGKIVTYYSALKAKNKM